MASSSRTLPRLGRLWASARLPGDNRIEITCIAYSDPETRKIIGTPRPGFPYSPGVLAGDTLYVSGKGDQLAAGGHPATFEEQVRQAMKNVETTLKEAGLDFRHVVMSHVFLDKYENLEVANRVYNEFFEDGNEPACATVFVNWIPGGSHVEVTCIATTDLPSRKVVRPSGMRYGTIDGSVTASPAVWAGNTLYLSGVPGAQSRRPSLAGQSRGPGAPDGAEPLGNPRGRGAFPRRYRLWPCLSSRHEGLQGHE